MQQPLLTFPQSPTKRPQHIEGKGWRYPTEHRMTRWPRWKDSRRPGTYMITLTINGDQKVLGTLVGTPRVVYTWMQTHPSTTAAASADPLYYRHALLSTRPMPWIPSTGSGFPSSGFPSSGSLSVLPCDGVSTPSSPSPSSRTHFPIEALKHPDAPRILLTPLGESVKAALERMPHVIPQVQLVCYSIMPNHLHLIIAVKETLKQPVGTVIRSFKGVTTHALHQLIQTNKIHWNPTHTIITRKASEEKPSLWQENYCVGVCYTEQKLHTRIGYILENPFFGILESEHPHFMERVTSITIAGRQYCGYGNMFLLKEPDRLQIFCHRNHPVTQAPYHQTTDFQNEKQAALDAAANGVVIVTPGISPGEADIMRSVLKQGGRVINIQKEELPLNGKWHPDKERRLYCSRGILLVLSVKDLPQQTFHDKYGNEIPITSQYARFHLLNLVAEEICQEGIEHQLRMPIK